MVFRVIYPGKAEDKDTGWKAPPSYIENRALQPILTVFSETWCVYAAKATLVYLHNGQSRWRKQVENTSHYQISKHVLALSISGESWIYPYQHTPMGNPYTCPIIWVFMGYNHQESLENTINTMGTRTLGVHPSLSLDNIFSKTFFLWVDLGSRFHQLEFSGHFLEDSTDRFHQPETAIIYVTSDCPPIHAKSCVYSISWQLAKVNTKCRKFFSL